MEWNLKSQMLKFHSIQVKLALPKRCRDCRNENRMKAGYRFTEEDHIKEKNYENTLKNLASKNNKNNKKIVVVKIPTREIRTIRMGRKISTKRREVRLRIRQNKN